MKATFKDGDLMTPTPVTDSLHKSFDEASYDDDERYAKMRWHAESLERQTQTLRSEIKMLKSRILKLEPERL